MKLHRIITIVDIECTCWPNAPPLDEKADTIEIGVCQFDRFKMEVVNNLSIPIKPSRSKVSEFCTNLTGWTQEKLDSEGVSFQEAIAKLEEIGVRRGLWCSWGDFDRKFLIEECIEKAVKYPFGPRHLNVKCLYALLKGAKTEIGLERAIKEIGFSFLGNLHSGKDDAHNISRVLNYLLTHTIKEL